MTTTRDRILQKVNPRLLQMKPKLSAGNGLFINLDSDDSLEEGTKELLMRFYRNQDLCEKNKRNASKNEVELTITRTRYNEGDEISEILSERFKLPCSKNEESLCDKPGKNLQKLKVQLQEKMSAKWEEEYKKRVNESKLNKGYKEPQHIKKKYIYEEYSSDKDFDPDDYSEEGKEESSEDDGCDGDVEDEEEKKDDSLTINATSVRETNDGPRAEETPFENSSKGVEFEDTESCSLPPAYQPGGGLLYGGSELTQCGDEDLPQSLLSPSFKLSVSESSQYKSLDDLTPNGKETTATEEFINSFSGRNKLFSQKSNDCFDLNDAYEFCSGKFPVLSIFDEDGLQSPLFMIIADESSNSQLGIETSTIQALNPTNQDEPEVNENEEKADESEDEISALVGKKPKKGQKIRKKVIIFDDSEDEEENSQLQVEYCEASKILSDDEEDRTDKVKKRRKNLQLSDEEDENGEGEKEEVNSDEEEKTDSDEEEKVDSDEEEKVDSDKEEEADSENEEEVDSGREEEIVKKNEEEKEVDEKDEERSVYYDSEENEIINPREFFEKEAELSGSEWSGDEDERGLDEFDVEEGDADILDNDEVRSQLEKIHLRQVLNEDAREVRLIQEILFEDGDLYSDGKGRDRKFRWKNLGKTFEENGEAGTKEEDRNSSEDEGAEEEQQRKLRHEKEIFLMEKRKNGDENSDEEIIQDFQSVKVTSVKSSRAGNFKLDHTEIGRGVVLSKSRGSFLTRNEEFLSSLVKVTSNISDNVFGPKHSKNFVFVTKSPEKMELNKNAACKRQVDDTEIPGNRREKKFKTVPPDVTGSSILDLLI